MESDIRKYIVNGFNNLTKMEFDDEILSICDSTAALVEGCRLPVRMHGTDDWPLAEIISIKDLHGRKCFYVHYVDFNKRLDEWVPEEYLDTRKVQFPRRDGTTTGQNTGISTPKKTVSTGNISRPTSPLLANELLNGGAVLAAALQKKMNRKRKAVILENDDTSQDGQYVTPRQSGSMVTHQDDVVTRMKNVEMIELGCHRIKPWYFAPYPQKQI